MNYTAEFTKERETKNKIRFQEAGDESDHGIGVLYVEKKKLDELGYDGGTLEVSVAVKE